MKRNVVLWVVVLGLLGMLCFVVYALTNNLVFVFEILLNFWLPVIILFPLAKVKGGHRFPYLFAGSTGTLIDLDHAGFQILALYGFEFGFIQPGRPITHSFLFVGIAVTSLYIYRAFRLWVTRKVWIPGVEDYKSADAIFATGIALTSHLLTDSLTQDPIIYWPVSEFIVLPRFGIHDYVGYILLLIFISWLYARRRGKF